VFEHLSFKMLYNWPVRYGRYNTAEERPEARKKGVWSEGKWINAQMPTVIHKDPGVWGTMKYYNWLLRNRQVSVLMLAVN
jgi:hypothetical protein